MEWVSIWQAAACKPHITKYNAKCWEECVKHTVTGLWSSGNLFCGVMITSLFSSLMHESGFDKLLDLVENVACPN